MLLNHNAWTWPLVVGGKYWATRVGLVPLAYFWLALLLGGRRAVLHPVSLVIEVYGMIEGVWYFAWFLPFKARLQKRGLPPPEMSVAQRKELLETLLSYVPDFPLFMRKWFNMAHLDEIYRDDVKAWLLWALWGTDDESAVDLAELDEYIAAAEDRFETKLRKGSGGAKPIRLTLDPVRMYHKSLMFYAFVGLGDIGTHLFLTFLGFSFWRQARKTFLHSFPFRPQTLLARNESAAARMSYYYRQGTQPDKYRPIVFHHGIGVGLVAYATWLATVPKEISIVVLESLAVSGRIGRPGMSTKQFVKSVRKVLEQQGIDDFVFVGHSYGTFMARPLLEDAVVSAKINSVVVADPVSIMLHLPAVAYNITRRKATTTPQMMISWGAAMDPMVAHTLCRRFHWQEHILFREHLAGKRATAIVASRDVVCDPSAIASYVYYGDVHHVASDVEEWKKTSALWTGRTGLELYYLWDRDHGQSLLVPAEAKRITKLIATYCDKTVEDSATPSSEKHMSIAPVASRAAVGELDPANVV